MRIFFYRCNDNKNYYYGHFETARFAAHLYEHWTFLQEKGCFFSLTLARGVKEKETVFTLSLDSSPTDHYIKLQNYLPAGRTE